MNRTVTGWTFVAIQGLLLGLLILLPGRKDWATPPWLSMLGFAIIVAGLAVIAISSVRLGPSLTATPIPTERGVLTTSGLYRYVRHPIYSGVLTIVVGVTLRSGSWLSAFVAVVTIAFFHQKARWEESRLAERYEEYTDYAAMTPRFVPRPWHVRRPHTWRRP